MLRHVVLMQLSNDATDAEVTAIVDGLETLPGLVPEIRNYTVGRDAGLSEGNADVVVIGEFDDEDGFTRYLNNADHQAVIVERIRPFLAARSAVQYFVD